MTLNKKILATAIVGGLFAAAAQAQVNISATTPVPVTFASELVVPAAGLTLTNLNTTTPPVGILDLQTALRYSFSAGEVRHARIECSPNIRFATGSVVTLSAGGTVGAINGIGTNAIHFSITAGTTPATATDILTVSGDRIVTNTAGGSCTYSLYDFPSQAAAGGSVGQIATATGAYLAFATSYTLTATPTGAVANVEANPAFSRFVSAAPTGSIERGSLGDVVFALRTAPATPRLASGAPATLAALLAAGSNHVVTGDFSAAADADGTFTSTAALARVYFSTTADCTAVTTSANVLTATSARFNTGPAAVNATLCFAPRSGVAIPVSTYSQVFNAVSANPTLFAPTGRGPVALGEITRNGTQLQAPLAQIPTGWISRVALTNTGTVARPYTITAQTEAGVTAALGTAANGIVPANGTVVLNVADIVQFTGTAPRGTLNVTVAGPTGQIQGLYQIVNPASGSISNHVMVRPGMN